MKFFETEPPIKCSADHCQTKFCSEQCHTIANDTYHRVLCGNDEINAVRELIRATDSPSSLCTPVMLKLVGTIYIITLLCILSNIIIAMSVQQNVDVDDFEGIYNLHGFIAKDTQVGPFRYAYHQIEQVIRSKPEHHDRAIEWDWYLNVCSKALLNMFGYDPFPAKSNRH